MITETNEVSTARDRVRGYREAIDGAGVAFEEGLVAETSVLDPRGAHDATFRLLDRLAGRLPERRRLVVLPADFIVRESSGAGAPVGG
jgi:DNA-binding LacI/PurR family transcriptional regulator